MKYKKAIILVSMIVLLSQYDNNLFFNAFATENDIFYSASETDILVSGDCNVYSSEEEEGKKLTWSLNTNTNTLTISGEGHLEKILDISNYAQNVQTIILDEGVTGVTAWYVFTSFTNLKELYISSTIEVLQVIDFNELHKLEKFTVSQDNEYFSSVDGVLYNKDKTTILKYPNGKQDSDFTVLNTVTTIGERAFQNNQYLENITVPEVLKAVNGQAFNNITNLKELNSFVADYVGSNLFGDILWAKDNIITVGDYQILENGLAISYIGEDNPDVIIPKKVKYFSIGIYSFSPETITVEGDWYIPSKTFFCNTTLKSITIKGNAYFNSDAIVQSNIESIFVGGDCTFDTSSIVLCNNLKTIHVDGNCNCNYYCFKWSSQIEELTVGKDCFLASLTCTESDKFENITIGGNCYCSTESCNNPKNFTVNGDCYFEVNSMKSFDNMTIGGNVDGYINTICDINSNISYNANRKHIENTIDNTNKVLLAEKTSESLPKNTLNTILNPNLQNKLKLNGYGVSGNINLLSELETSTGDIYVAINLGEKVLIVSKDNPDSIVEFTYSDFVAGTINIDENDNIYILWGKYIDDEEFDKHGDYPERPYNMDTENIVLKKYSLDGSEISSVGFPIKDTRAQHGFWGSVDICFDDNLIYILCTVQWYRSDGVGEDNAHHQGADVLIVDSSTMTLKYVDSLSCSHSLSGVLLTTNFGCMTFQRNDTHFRGIQINEYSIDKSNEITQTDGICKIYCSFKASSVTDDFPSDYYEPYVSLCGVSKNETTIAILGQSEKNLYTTIPEDYSQDVANLFIQVFDANTAVPIANEISQDRIDLTTDEVGGKNVIWLTDYSISNSTRLANSNIFTLENGLYCVMWQEYEYIPNQEHSIDDERTYYVLIDDCGHIIQEKTEIIGARLSNNLKQPIVQGNTVTWAVPNSYYNCIDWYTVNFDNLETKTSHSTIDILLLKKYLLGMINPSNNLEDINNDGNVNIIDLCTLKNEILSSSNN